MLERGSGPRRRLSKSGSRGRADGLVGIGGEVAENLTGSWNALPCLALARTVAGGSDRRGQGIASWRVGRSTGESVVGKMDSLESLQKPVKGYGRMARSDSGADRTQRQGSVAKLRQAHTPDAIRRRLSGAPGVSYLRDFIYGAIDGAVTTFAVVAGVIGAGL